ncbi:hypothetical protein EVAR_56332_1 [Eumeta japonica]|uniref:Uncharacterized protein n=1 Tax=Eumeta variegata TaxID=151549 RepID=A0A4C1YE96_EUMVA|nr:hypothetical protein EVAR_56332_1 [Eumeta japonica]
MYMYALHGTVKSTTCTWPVISGNNERHSQTDLAAYRAPLAVASCRAAVAGGRSGAPPPSARRPRAPPRGRGGPAGPLSPPPPAVRADRAGRVVCVRIALAPRVFTELAN